MNTIHDFHASVESISQLWNLFHQVRNEGNIFTTLEFISPGNLQEQISHQWNLYNIIFLWNMFYQNLYHRKLFLGKLFSQELILAHTHTYQSISEDLLDRVRIRLLTELVFTVGLETFWAVVENTEVDKLCLLVKDLQQLLWY